MASYSVELITPDEPGSEWADPSFIDRFSTIEAARTRIELFQTQIIGAEYRILDDDGTAMEWSSDRAKELSDAGGV